eukprot:scaffold151258_cov69-Attheya_sp.AAC.2
MLGDTDCVGPIDSYDNPLDSVVGVGLSLGPMLGAEEGSMDIDGVYEGTILGFEDGSIDAEGKVLSSIAGVRLILGLMLGVDAGSMDMDGFTEDGNSLGSVVGVRLMIGPMLGAENGSTDIDGEDEGLINGPILCVEGSLEFSLGESDTVGRSLPLKDGPIDVDGTPLIFIVGEILMLGPMLADSVGGALALKDGRIDMSGTSVGFRDGGVVVLMDGAVLTLVGLTLGFSVGKCETDGSELALGWLLGGEVGPMDNVGFDEGSSLRESDGAWLGLRDTDGCMLGLEFGSITLND